MTHSLLFGLILFDIIKGKKYIGGPAINIALHMAFFGQQPTLVSCVGDDELGDMAKNLLSENSINIEFVNTHPLYETGWVNVFLDTDGNPSFEIIKPVAYDYISMREDQIKKLAKIPYDIFYFGTVVQRNLQSQKALRMLLEILSINEVFYDINLRPGHYSKDIVDFSLKQADILKLNVEELTQVSDLFGIETRDETWLVDWLMNTYSINTVLLTRGEKGASVYDKGRKKDIEGIKVRVKDTVGSGDAFSAGFIMEYLHSGDVLLAAHKGNELGAYVATKSGAVPELDDEHFRKETIFKAKR